MPIIYPSKGKRVKPYKKKSAESTPTNKFHFSFSHRAATVKSGKKVLYRLPNGVYAWRKSRQKKKKKPYYIQEPFGLPFELTEKDKYRQVKAGRR